MMDLLNIRIGIILLFTSASIVLNGQYTPMEEYGIVDGLPSNLVYDIVQDNLGYYWMGTDKGLVQFDGYEFKTYTVEDGLPVNEIVEVDQDSEGRIWCRETTMTPTFILNEKIYTPLEQQVLNANIFEEKNETKLYYYRYKNDSLYALWIASFKDKVNIYIDEYYEQHQGVPLYRFDLMDKVFFMPYSYFIRKVRYFESSDSLKYVEYPKVVENYEIKKVTNLERSSYFKIKYYQDKDATQIFNDNKLFKHYHNNNKLELLGKVFPSSTISRMYQDDMDQYWYTDLSKLYYSNSFVIENQVKQYDISCSEVLFDSIHNTVLINTAEGIAGLDLREDKIIHFDARTNDNLKLEHLLLQQKQVYYFHKSNGFYLLNYDGETYRPEQINIELGKASFIEMYNLCKKLIISENNKILITKVGCFISAEPSTWTKIPGRYFDGIVSNDTIVYLQSAEQLVKLKLNQLDTINLSYKIEKLKQFSANEVIFQTLDKRIYLSEKEEIIELEDLRGRSLSSTTTDKDDIYLLFEDEIIICNKKADGYTFKSLIPKHALGRNYVYNDIVVVDSTIYLATNKGLLSFNKEVVLPRKVVLPLNIESIATQDSVYDYLYHKDLPSITYANNDIEITYKCITPNSKDMDYRYQLVGADDGWQRTTSTTLRYPVLDYGRYTFKVKAEDIYGNQSEDRQMVFTILPPWYHTWWARGLGLGLCIGLVYLIIRNRVQQARAEEQVQSRINKKFAELELNALQSQMNPHFIFNTLNGLQSLINKGEDKKADIYIVKFAKLVRQFLEASQHKFITLAEELSILDKYVEIEQLRFNDRIQYKVDNQLELEAEEIKVPSTLLQPFVENAINHGLFHKEGIGHLSIKIYRDGPAIKIEIEDDGIGRQQSGQINKGREGHVSYATRSIRDKIELLHQMDLMDVTIAYEDLNDAHNKSTGTKVIISINETS